MNSLVIYDSLYGNTEIIAETIARSLKTKALDVREVRKNSLRGAHLLIFGSPTQGGRPTQAMADFLKSIPSEIIANKKLVTFDTRLGKEKSGWALRMLMNIIGFAAEKMDKDLKNKGANLIAKPEGFIVTDGKGPLAKGEIERAEKWGIKLAGLSERSKTYVKHQ